MPEFVNFFVGLGRGEACRNKSKSSNTQGVFMTDSQLDLLNKNLALHNKILQELISVIKLHSKQTDQKITSSINNVADSIEDLKDVIVLKHG